MRFSLLKNFHRIWHSPSQKKILAFAAMTVVFLFLFILLVYLPGRSTTTRLKRELAQTRARVSELQAVVNVGRNIRQGINLVKDKYTWIIRKFPGKEEESIQLLNELTQGLNVEIISINPQPKVPYFDEKNKPVFLDGRSLQSGEVSLALRCMYKDLMLYIQRLNDSLPGYIFADRIKISRDKENSLKLLVDMEFRLYLLK